LRSESRCRSRFEAQSAGHQRLFTCEVIVRL
jgi:hypothetical protein